MDISIIWMFKMMRQVALVRSFNGKGVDYNFINKDYYDSLVDEKGKSLVKE